MAHKRMDTEIINNPVVETFEASKVYNGLPEITDIQYNLWLLRITAHFLNIDNPVYITFDAPRGFRILDEGDLLEFWNKETRAKGWLWVVEKGGWFDLEAYREGFVSGATAGYSEFLILGENDCVSVITSEEPGISASKP